MAFLNSWPPLLVVLAAVLTLAATPFFRPADAPPIATPDRVETLDGLRGFLALSVFFHHAFIYRTFAQTGEWGMPTDRFYGLLGSFGVSMFFMITGNLFWSQMIKKRGRPDWLKLYIGRLFRIGPLYLFTIGFMLLIILASTGFKLQVSPLRLASEVGTWLWLGAKMGIAINGYGHMESLISVAWSLRYEWIFYVSLALTSLLARSRVLSALGPALALFAALVIMMWTHPQESLRLNAAFLALFACGMLCAAVQAFPKFRAKRFGVPGDFLAIACALGVLTTATTAYAPLAILALGAAFGLISSGFNLFGLLSWRACKRLGNISYGIYLLQLPVLGAAYSVPALRQCAIGSPLGYWVITSGACLVLVLLALVCHAAIERPGIEWGLAVHRRASTLFKIPVKPRSGT